MKNSKNSNENRKLCISPISGAAIPAGRPRGVKNKVPKSLKAAFLEVFERMGGAEGLYRWATKSEKNRTVYLQLLSKLLPQELEHGGGIQITVHRIITERPPND